MGDRAGFFAGPPPGLAVFLNAGDPPLEVMPDVLSMLDESGVDVLELAVPFPDSFTDGPVVRRSARRALDRGAGLAEVLACVSRAHDRLTHLRIALLADWSHTIRPIGMAGFLGKVRDSGSDALLTHGLPAVARQQYYEAAHTAGVPVVTTCYPGSSPEVLAESAQNATAYVYLVAHYGRSGTSPGEGYTALRPALSRLREHTTAPVAVGFGVRGRAEVAQLRQLGADAAVVGSAAVAVVEHATKWHRDVTSDLARFIAELRAPQRTQTAREDAVT
ncbi:tryptophan synthase subunit alpha [Kibdelosporangium phytohabitans]|uniref:Tryptophan synthase alpha chain n=1 Tax=Kibdelosporangium phytohabitans TaxID=860235 RepID=A0A0N9HVM6_9PSEU|nr:tryptophan synthase subunit alpha [Kibdelosporangium phytohabitans]ALG09246.1 tryptophan synthase subunit alpha [Kibdelosporangium phytohabitans]MBE1469514.1 tryptophan synthase alpha chain [Kibdelosporangium phytohabitans]